MIGRLLQQRYRVISALGAGGFGHTYIAEDTQRPNNPKCVVKHLQPSSNDPNYLQVARRLFNKEAETLENLGRHGQIPQLLAYFEENKQFFLVQEFIDGHPLYDELSPSQVWTQKQVINLLMDVLGVLDFVHQNNVIHRDIKPANLIRRHQDHKLVLIDFGIVKELKTQVITNQNQITSTVAIGTPGYMPAEQGQGKPRYSSDIYALGIVAIQALTGLDPANIPEDHNTGELVWQDRAQISSKLKDILTKMVRYHWANRYNSAAEVLADLNSLVSPQPLAKTEPSKKPQTTTPNLTRQRFLQFLGWGGMTVLGVGIVEYFRGLQSNGVKSDPSPTPQESPTPLVYSTPKDAVKPLKVATEPSFPPFEMTEEGTGKLTGFDIELMDAISKEAGLNIEYESLPFDGIIPALQAGTVQAAISGILITKERAETLSFSRPYFKAGLAIAVQEKNNSIKDFADLKGKKIAVQIGTTGAKEAAKIEGAEITQFDSAVLALQKLVNGEVDAVVNDGPVTLYAIKKAGLQGVKVVGELLTEEYYGIALPKDSPNVQKVNDAIARLLANGTYQAIYEKWFAGKPPELPFTFN